MVKWLETAHNEMHKFQRGENYANFTSGQDPAFMPEYFSTLKASLLPSVAFKSKSLNAWRGSWNKNI